MRIKKLATPLFIILFFCCNSKAYELPEDAIKLLTNNSTKSWKLAKRTNDGYRMNMGDCFLSYRVYYSMDGTTTDNNKDHKDCGDSMEANWSFFSNDDGSYIKLKGQKVKTLLNIDQDYKFFKILELSDSLLIISFTHKQFGNKERTIIDYLVREDVVVEDRNFHN